MQSHVVQLRKQYDKHEDLISIFKELEHENL